MLHKTYSRICIVDSVYTLLLYLLYSSEEEINHTYFFFQDGIHKSIREKFKNCNYFKTIKKKIFLIVIIPYRFLSIKLMRHIRWPFLKEAHIYGHDHLLISNYLINKKYTLIEDGPYSFQIMFNIWEKEIDNFYKNKIIIRRIMGLFLGKTWGPAYLGNNDLCEEVIMTENKIKPYMQNKKIITISLFELWQKSLNSKKELILFIFNITNEDLILLKNKKNILFTQTFYDDGLISKEEHYRIYNKVINNYDPASILIKTHPRETIDYKKLFHGILIFNKAIPIQLLNLLNIKFIKAITVCSSAVLSFGYDLEIDWYGTEISERLFNKLGKIECPILCNKVKR